MDSDTLDKGSIFSWKRKIPPGGPCPSPGEKEEGSSHLFRAFWDLYFPSWVGFTLFLLYLYVCLKPVGDAGRQLAGVKDECNLWGVEEDG